MFSRTMSARVSASSAHALEHLDDLPVDQAAERVRARRHAAREQAFDFVHDAARELRVDTPGHALAKHGPRQRQADRQHFDSPAIGDAVCAKCSVSGRPVSR